MARRALGPSSLAVVQAVRASLDQTTGPVRVGCSGGADSTALALGVAHVIGERPWQVMVVDHGLQPDSDLVARQVAGRLAARGLPVVIQSVEVVFDGRGLEAAARDARYAALGRPVSGQQPIVLVGHTLDDQAESVLLGLARGSGATSLSGMAEVNGIVHRPLLGLERATTVAACREWGVETWQDPTNDSTDFLRSRVRHEVMPVLEKVLGPGVAQALARTADLLRTDAELLDVMAAEELAELGGGTEGRLPCQGLAVVPTAVRTRVLRLWIAQQTGRSGLSRERVEAVDSLLVDWRGQKHIDLPGGVRVVRLAGALVIEGATAG